MKRLTRTLRAVGVGASPPCKARSTARMRGVPQDPDLIDETRAMLRASGLPWAMENVTGARSSMLDATVLRGSFFGLAVDRPRLFETSFPLHVDRVLLEGGGGSARRQLSGAQKPLEAP